MVSILWKHVGLGQAKCRVIVFSRWICFRQVLSEMQMFCRHYRVSIVRLKPYRSPYQHEIETSVCDEGTSARLSLKYLLLSATRLSTYSLKLTAITEIINDVYRVTGAKNVTLLAALIILTAWFISFNYVKWIHAKSEIDVYVFTNVVRYYRASAGS